MTHLCWRKIWQPICLRSIFWSPVQEPEKTPSVSGASEQTSAIPTIEPIVPHCFFHWPWSLKEWCSSEPQLTSSFHFKLSWLYSGYIYASTLLNLRFDLEIRLFYWNWLTLSLFPVEHCLSWKCLSLPATPLITEVVSPKHYWVLNSLAYYSRRAIFWRLAIKIKLKKIFLKPLFWLLLDQAASIRLGWDWHTSCLD